MRSILTVKEQIYEQRQQYTTKSKPTSTKNIVESHYVGIEKMEAVFKQIAEEQITKKVKELFLVFIKVSGKITR